MNVWGWLALVLAILASYAWVWRMSYNTGKRKGKEESDAYWTEKINTFYQRIGDPSDDGVSVSDGSVWQGPKSGTTARLVTGDGTADTEWCSR